MMQRIIRPLLAILFVGLFVIEALLGKARP